jgi:hypothetical protein
LHRSRSGGVCAATVHTIAFRACAGVPRAKLEVQARKTVSVICGETPIVTVLSVAVKQSASWPIGVSIRNLKHPLDLDCKITGQRGSSDRSSDMPSGIAEYSHHQIRCAVEDFRMIEEVRGRVNEASETHNRPYTIQIAVQSHAEMSKQVDSADPSGLLPLFNRNLGSKLPGKKIPPVK